jgi:NAD(P)H-dependent flavin oxidoreductase YrpB (nitropropane dioxygenase family)
VTVYPVVKVKAGSIRRIGTVWKKKEALENLQRLCNTNDMVYVLDVDGYRRNSPNLAFYKKIRGRLWVDADPRDVMDVMDLFVSGAARVTLWAKDDDVMRELTELVAGDIFIRDHVFDRAVRLARTHGLAGVVTEGTGGAGETEAWALDREKEEIVKIE